MSSVAKYLAAVTGTYRAFENWPSCLSRAAFFHLAKRPVPIRWKTRGGTVICSPPGNACWPVYEIFASDSYRLASLYQDRNVRTVVDIGANIGAFALAVTELFPRCKVKAFEPAPRVFNSLQKNVSLNQRTDRVLCDPHAVVGNSSGSKISLFEFEGTSPRNTATSGALNGSERGHWIDVPAVTLASVLAEFPEIDILKVDTEGSEYAIFDMDGLKALSSVKSIVVEYHPVDSHSREELSAGLHSVGFSTVAHEPTVDPNYGVLWLHRM